MLLGSEEVSGRIDHLQFPNFGLIVVVDGWLADSHERACAKQAGWRFNPRLIAIGGECWQFFGLYDGLWLGLD
jgi:hypothetical protein